MKSFGHEAQRHCASRSRCQALVALAMVIVGAMGVSGCRKDRHPRITVGSKFFTEQVLLAELLAQQIEVDADFQALERQYLAASSR